MSLFGNMFNEADEDEFIDVDHEKYDNKQTLRQPATGRTSLCNKAEPPTAPRPAHGLCGIKNRGATCYLNSLLQSLAMTPDFRERLFQLSPDELGLCKDENGEITCGSKMKARIIPIQLQRLFAQLLLLNAESVSTDELTASFGWTNNEERDQQDVQELNRILFSAIEESLVGTRGEHLIRDLYHGTMVNSIQCLTCGRTSERVEDFLDLCISTAGTDSLEEGLTRLFLETEKLDSSNQYMCSSCGRLTDAVKQTKLRRTPAVLTISILRFSYDPINQQRQKETGRFAFPKELDISVFCEAPSSSPAAGGIPHSGAGEPCVNGGSSPPPSNENGSSSSSCTDKTANGEVKCAASKYELFSVVVHRGGAHGGHYHALIRDIDSLGKWTAPENDGAKPAAAPKTAPAARQAGGGRGGGAKKVRFEGEPTTVATAVSEAVTINEFVDCDSPRSVIASVLGKCGRSNGLSMDNLCSQIYQQTGVSWKNRFKKKHGSLIEFLRSNADAFVFNEEASWVSLCPDAVQNRSETGSHSDGKENGCAKQEPVTNGCGDSQSNLPDAAAASGPSTDETTSNGAGATDAAAEADKSHVDNADAAAAAASASTAQQERGSHWFDFNDANVRPINASDIDKQFSGKECAYMLFYRRVEPTIKNKKKKKKNKTSSSCSETSRAHVQLPDFLVSDVDRKNTELCRLRSQYEETVNRVGVEIHFGQSYEYKNGALQPLIEQLPYMEHVIDRRWSVAKMLEEIVELGGELVEKSGRPLVHVARSMPCGLHLYQEITADMTATLASLGIGGLTKLFVWNGQQFNGYETGADCEPVLFRIESDTPGSEAWELGIGKNSTVGRLKAAIAEKYGCRKGEVSLTLKSKGKPLTNELDTLSECGLQGRAAVVASISTGANKRASSLPQSPTNGHIGKPTMMTPPTVNSPARIQLMAFRVENRLGDGNPSFYDVEVESSASVEELKVVAVTTAELPYELCSDSRLRVEYPGTLALGPPLHESADLLAAGLTSGSQLVLERGKPPSATQLVLTVTVPPGADVEVFADNEMTVGDLQRIVLTRSSPDGANEWHLCRADWANEAGAVLPSDQSIGDCSLRNGDRLLLQPGNPPPPGFVRISVYLALPKAHGVESSTDRVQDKTSGVCHLDDIDLSKQTTLLELKKKILLMDAVALMELPSAQYLRLRSLSLPSCKMGAIIRNHGESLQKLRLVSGSAVVADALTAEENLSPLEIPLVVKRRVPGSRSYSECDLQVTWDISQGATASSLYRVVESNIGEQDGVCIAKYFEDKFEWLSIKPTQSAASPSSGFQTKSKGKKNKKKGTSKKGAAGAAGDLRQAPYFLQDCDVIGVKVAGEDDGDLDDFSTEFDDRQLDELRRKKAERDAQCAKSKAGADEQNSKQRRPEVAMKIHVENFR